MFNFSNHRNRMSGGLRRSSRLEVESLEGRALPATLGAPVVPVAAWPPPPSLLGGGPVDPTGAKGLESAGQVTSIDGVFGTGALSGGSVNGGALGGVVNRASTDSSLALTSAFRGSLDPRGANGFYELLRKEESGEELLQRLGGGTVDPNGAKASIDVLFKGGATGGIADRDAFPTLNRNAGEEIPSGDDL